MSCTLLHTQSARCFSRRRISTAIFFCSISSFERLPSSSFVRRVRSSYVIKYNIHEKVNICTDRKCPGKLQHVSKIRNKTYINLKFLLSSFKDTFFYFCKVHSFTISRLNLSRSTLTHLDNTRSLNLKGKRFDNTRSTKFGYKVNKVRIQGQQSSYTYTQLIFKCQFFAANFRIFLL